MSVGTLQTKVVVHNASRVRYGSNDPISGHVVVTFHLRLASKGELFGPLKVSVFLTGESKIKMWKKMSNTYSRGQQSLFSISSTIYDEPFRSKAGQSHEFPFVMYFPQTVDPDSTSGWNENVRFPVEAASTLPPSFSDKPSGIQGRLESAIMYKLEAIAEMPGVKLDPYKPRDGDGPIVLYERPRLPRPVDVTWHKILFEQGKGFGDSDLKFVTCESPRQLYCEQPATFKVQLDYGGLERNAAMFEHVIPKVYLTAFGVELRATTAVRGKRMLRKHPQMSVQTSVATLICAVDNTAPFTRSEGFTKQVITGKIPSVPSTFNSMNISRLYHLELELVLKCEGKTTEPITRSYGVVVHPPLEPRRNATTPRGSLAGTTAVSHVLPEYERPPEYETVSGE